MGSEFSIMTKILLVDDHAVVRDGIKRMFDSRPNTVFFGEADNRHAAMKLALERDWDVVVLDLSLGEGSGMDVLRDLKKVRPRVPVLIFTVHTEDHYARRAFKAGAAGYLTK